MALRLDDDDDATLAAALALIDEWEASADDGALSSVTAGTDSDTASSAGSSSPPATVTSSRRRKVRSDEAPRTTVQTQRRDELVFLRRTVRELESQLTSLNERRSSDEKASQLPSQAIDAAHVWKQIASRQSQHRAQAEAENERLRLKTQEQVAIAKQLMRVLMRAHCDAEKSASDDGTGSSKRIRLTHDRLGMVSVDDQLRRIEELRVESDAIFSEAPFTDGPPVFRDVRVLEHANGEATINIDCSWVLPYPVDQVTSAFWTFLIRKTERRECGFQNCAEETRDILVTPYESNEAAARLVGKFVGRFVARRVLPGDATPGLMLWDMRAEPVDFKPMSMDGVSIHNETAMRVVWADQVSGASSSTTTGRMALVQMSQRVHVRFAAAETPTRRRRVGALTNYVFYTVESELEWKQQMLETLLLRHVPPSASIESWSG